MRYNEDTLVHRFTLLLVEYTNEEPGPITDQGGIMVSERRKADHLSNKIDRVKSGTAGAGVNPCSTAPAVKPDQQCIASCLRLSSPLRIQPVILIRDSTTADPCLQRTRVDQIDPTSIPLLILSASWWWQVPHAIRSWHIVSRICLRRLHIRRCLYPSH